MRATRALVVSAIICTAHVWTAAAASAQGAEPPQTPPPETPGALVLRIAGSTRALGLGDAFPVGTTDSDAVFYNAAFGEALRGASLGVQWYGTAATSYTASGAMEWWGGALAFGLRTLSHGGAMTEGELHATVGADATSENAASLAYARRVKGLRLGVTAHLLEERRASVRGVGGAVDLAAGITTSFAAAGLTLRNLGPDYTVGTREVKLPTELLLALAAPRSLPVGPLDLLPVASLRYDLDDDVVPAAGLEVSYWPVQGRTFTVRAGARRAAEGLKPFTLGAGFAGDRILIDYALVPSDDGGVSHRAGVRWR